MNTTNDLGSQRGLSDKTLKMFNVRQNGSGWLYDFKLTTGGSGTRWKSFYSTKEAAPEDQREGWKKYTWYPEKMDGAKYFYPNGMSLVGAIQEASNHLWIVGGDIASMTMFEGGIYHVISCFGDNDLPNSLIDDLENWKVLFLHIAPDRDKSGLEWAVKIRDMVYERLPEIQIKVYALPYDLRDKHGKDVNDFWIDEGKPVNLESELMGLDEWVLPERQPTTQQTKMRLESDEQEIPERLKAEIRFHLGVREQFNGEGWSRKNVACPFHKDDDPSATWNDDMAILKCFAGCGKNYLAKDLCEHFGIRMADYFEHEPTVLLKSIPVIDVPKAPPQPALKRYAPPLSAFAQLTPEQEGQANRGRVWLDDYIAWAKQAGPLSPDIFYEAIGLWTLSMASARRMCIRIGGEEIYPNLYIFIVAPTTVYRKTTALNIARSLLKRTRLEFMLMPERATPEALFDYMAGKLPMNMSDLSPTDQEHLRMGRVFAAQRALYIDEASGLLSEMKRDYNAGLTEILLEGYDGTKPMRKILKGAGLVSVREMCLSVLAATTPIEWSRRMGVEERQNGFVARFAIITPESPPIYEDTVDEVDVPSELIRRLWHYFARVLPWDKRTLNSDGTPKGLSPEEEVEPPPIVNPVINPEAMKQIARYRRALGFDMLASAGGTVEDDKAGQYARLGTMVIKLSMLLAAADTYKLPVIIEPHHVYAAQMICERWRESLHRLDVHLQQSKADSVDDRLVAFIRAAGEMGVTQRDIQRGCNTNGLNVDAMLKTLMDAGLVERFQRKSKGRPAVAYRIFAVNHDE